MVLAQDYWNPDPEDPFWMLEATFGESQGAWLKNRDSCLTTRDPLKALRYPSKWHADLIRGQLHNPACYQFTPTEHLWCALAGTKAGRELGGGL